MTSEKTVQKDARSSFFSPLDLGVCFVIVSLVTYWYIRKCNMEKKKVEKMPYLIVPTPIAVHANPEASFLEKLKSTNRRMVSFYGSQTGTAEEFASRIAKEGVYYQLKGIVSDPEESDPIDLSTLPSEVPNNLAVFLLATYGEGDPTDNFQEMYNWIMNDESDLTGLNYSVFGLGNKTYEHFNKVAIDVDGKLAERGAKRIYQCGIGDDDCNIDDDFVTWKEGFWAAVCEEFGTELRGGDNSIMRQYKTTIYTEEDMPPPVRIFTGEVSRVGQYRNQIPTYHVKNPYLSKILAKRELHKGGERSCMHIELAIEQSMQYTSGDHVGIYPQNDSKMIDKLGELLNENLDTLIMMTAIDESDTKKHPFPMPCTYRTAFTHYLDITSHPRVYFLQALVNYCSEEEDKEKLLLICASKPEGKQAYHKFIIEENRNIVQLLMDLPSLKPPIDLLCEILPRLQCRYYSISSSPNLYPSSVHVTAIKVDYVTPLNRRVEGVCTSFLSKIKLNESGTDSHVPIFLRKSTMRLPVKSDVSIIMIGPGTGYAPFRAFIQERNADRIAGKKMGLTILYYGCRNKDEDFIYQEEIEEYIANGTLKVHFAFSREQEEKVYVTHLLEKNMDELWEVIDDDGYIYVCGDARCMARDVHNIVLKTIEEKGEMTAEEAQKYVKSMEAKKRYSTDVWS